MLDNESNYHVHTDLQGDIMKSIISFCVAAFLHLIGTACSAQVQWKQLENAFDLRITPLLSAPDGMLLIGTEVAGIVRSTDGGTTWRNANTGILKPDIVSLIKGTHNGEYFTGNIDGNIYRSTDAGESWTHYLDGPIREANVEIDPDGNVYVWTPADGLYAYAQSLAWQKIYSGIDVYSQPNVMRFLPDGVILIGTQGNGIVRSTDSGATWNPAWNKTLKVERFHAAFPHVLFAATESSLLRSLDDGATWSPSASPNPNANVPYMLSDSAGTLFTSGSGRIFSSIDTGRTWTRMTDVQTPNLRYAVFTRNHRMVRVQTYEGLFFSDDSGKVWTQSVAGVRSRAVAVIRNDSSGNIYLGTQTSLMMSIDYGKIWNIKHIDPNGDGIHALALDRKDILYAAANWDSCLFRSSNHGATWDVLIPKEIQTMHIFCIEVDERDNIYVPDDENEIYISSDHGENWRMISGPSLNIQSFLVSRKGTLLAVANRNIFRSSDDGSTWQSVYPYMGTNRIEMFRYGDSLVTCNGHDILISVDDGISWTHTKSLPSGYFAKHITIDSLGTIYAGTDNSGIIFISSDFGMNWVKTETILFGGAPKQVKAMHTMPDGTVIAAVEDHGLFIASKNSQTGITAWAPMAREFRLDTYPNPVASGTTLSYTTYEPGEISVSIYDLYGRKRMVLFEGNLAIGQHSLRWDVGNTQLPSGIYCIVLQAGRTSIAKNIVYRK